LLKFGFARGRFEARPDDGLELVDCRIANAVRCVPPENKPVGAEISTCRRFLADEIAAMPRLAAIVALGGIAHQSAVAAFGLRKALAKFGHGSRHDLPRGVVLFGSYHCSRYNTNTGRLTEAMFHQVFAAVRQTLH
jgi:uracil-DNA glycosylase family 4